MAAIALPRARSCAATSLLVCSCALLLLLLPAARASGFFELQVLGIDNPGGLLLDGGCCGSRCPGRCNTYFRLCLKEYQAQVDLSGACTFGNLTSPLIGGSSFSLQTHPDQQLLLRLPFHFRWTRSFTLILEALHHNNYTEPYVDRPIERLAYSGLVLPSEEWHTLRHPGRAAQLSYRIRVTCAANYYGPSCWTLCKPRDDRFGHYRCARDGSKQCRPGWTGSTCETPVCRRGCHPVHGYCERPGECVCRPGWRSELCDHCAPYPGCRHGYCNNTPWQCICDLNWGGILCDQDLNYCGTHEPCMNGGTCEHTAGAQRYLCRCRPGFSGTNCELGRGAPQGCLPAACLNGGSCVQRNGTWACACAPGWTGYRCQDLSGCLARPCQNGGDCVASAQPPGFRCICPVGYGGARCERDEDPCHPNPCAHGASCFSLGAHDYYCHCTDRYQGKNCTQDRPCGGPGGQPCSSPASLQGCAAVEEHGGGASVCGPHGRCVSSGSGPATTSNCVCDAGYTGRYCHENINDCAHQPCVNGGTCVDAVNSYKCICPEGWEGPHCSKNRDECQPNPCHNGGRCTDLIADFLCECQGQWKGKTCNLRDSHCDSDTCLNGGTCEDIGDTFVCHCPENYHGHTCQMAKVNGCESNPCQNGATCVNSGRGFSCMCREGFEGPLCQQNVDDCASSPCHNGGRCIDGVNWFRCECARGFAGPDCRINVDECASNPCAPGSVCVDAIGDFECRCAPGRTGKRCNVVLVTPASYQPCEWKGIMYPEGSRWQEDCSLCSCHSGAVTCIPSVCPESGCDPSGPTEQCPPGEGCLSGPPAESCFVRPCAQGGQPRGHCAPLLPGLANQSSNCLPNAAEPSNACAKITLLFDRRAMAPGTTVESVCSNIRRLSARRSIIILCAQKLTDADSIEVTVSTPGHPSASTYATVSETARSLADVISRKLTNHTVLSSVIEVKVETSFVGLDQKNTGRSYLLAATVTLVGVALLGLLAALTVWFLRSHPTLCRCPLRAPMTGVIPSVSGKLDGGSPEPDKSNNQNEENMRRYQNPLRAATNADVGAEASPIDARSAELFKPPSLAASKNTNRLCDNSVKQCEKDNPLSAPCPAKVFPVPDADVDTVVVLV
ncbi:protein serrate [Rhipicephalus microplus]|uniref:protein serrate n=1 Tax=Rhipicephalus microplus TaxID=6941 RepID=UPI003F6BD40B